MEVAAGLVALAIFEGLERLERLEERVDDNSLT